MGNLSRLSVKLDRSAWSTSAGAITSETFADLESLYFAFEETRGVRWKEELLGVGTVAAEVP